MPKIVDHDERCRDIAAAVLRIVARDGVRGANLRAVAEEAGWSTGVIAHYFGDKQALLIGTLREAAVTVEARMRAIAERKSGLERLIGLLEAGMPLDDERAATCRIFYHFSAEGMSDAAFLRELGAYYAAWRSAVARAVADLQCDGLFPHATPAAQSETLVSLAEGLGVQGLFDPAAMPPRRMRQRLLEVIEALSGADLKVLRSKR